MGRFYRQLASGTCLDCGPTVRFCDPWPVHTVQTVALFQALKRCRSISSLFFFLYGVVWAYGHTHSTHRNPETLNSQSLSHLSSLPLPHCSLSSLISASLPRRHRPPFSTHLVTLSITLCLSLTLPRRHRPPRAAQIAARSLNHSLPLSYFASSPSATTSCPDRSSLSQSLFAFLSLCLIAIAPSPTLCHSSTSTHFDSALARYFILFNSSFFYVNSYFLANLLCKIICDQLCYVIIACESIYMFVFVNIYSYMWTVNYVFGYLEWWVCCKKLVNFRNCMKLWICEFRDNFWNSEILFELLFGVMGLSWILEILFELWSSILYFRDNFYVFL